MIVTLYPAMRIVWSIIYRGFYHGIANGGRHIWILNQHDVNGVVHFQHEFKSYFVYFPNRFKIIYLQLWKESLRQGLSTILQKSTNRTINFHLNSLNKGKDHCIWRWISISYIDTGKKRGEVQPVNGVPTLLTW